MKNACIQEQLKLRILRETYFEMHGRAQFSLDRFELNSETKRGIETKAKKLRAFQGRENIA